MKKKRRKVSVLMEISHFDRQLHVWIGQSIERTAFSMIRQISIPTKKSKWLKFFPFEHRSTRFTSQARTLLSNIRTTHWKCIDQQVKTHRSNWSAWTNERMSVLSAKDKWTKPINAMLRHCYCTLTEKVQKILQFFGVFRIKIDQSELFLPFDAVS